MKILMLVPVWHRPDIVAMFLRHFKENPCPYARVELLFIVSPEDTAYRQIMTIIEGHEFCEFENHPLGKKKNRGLRHALSLKWDYLMDMGSDDVYTSVMWSLYEDLFKAKYPYFGLKNIYFYNSLTDEARFIESYHIGHNDEVTAIGPGRCIRRDVVTKNIPLWDDNAPFGMDGFSDRKIRGSGVNCYVIDNSDIPAICDVKSGVVLTPFEFMADMGHDVNSAFVKDAFDLWCMQPDISDFDGFHRQVRRISTQTQNLQSAFDIVNGAHERVYGKKRYRTYNSYMVMVTKNGKK